MTKLSLVWLRRELRHNDNKIIAKALEWGDEILPIFIFDKNILKRFSNKNDPRLSFLYDVVNKLNNKFAEFNGELNIFYGDSIDIITNLVAFLAEDYEVAVFAGEDFEPSSKKRDSAVYDNLQQQKKAKLNLVLDHLLIHPDKLLKDDEEPYKVYTPFKKKFYKIITDQDYKSENYQLKNKIHKFSNQQKSELNKQYNLLLWSENILQNIGYNYVDYNWSIDKFKNNISNFFNTKINAYQKQRDFLAELGTSQISPFLRFGLISIRELYSEANNCDNSQTWLDELVWREFYAYILHNYPETVDTEFQEKYRKLAWHKSDDLFKKWCDGQTGYPIIDAAMRQLKTENWMHNRARMIVASFLTKDLLIDWRKGEEHFAQYLMDYEQASNVGGWQWAASTGTDAQPYFRIFNPILQSKKFDSKAEYIKKYVPELKDVDSKVVHDPFEMQKKGIKPDNYPDPIVDHYKMRDQALQMFKEVK